MTTPQAQLWYARELSLKRSSNRMPSPGTDRLGIISATARANGLVVALECICIADIARVPQYLDAGQ
jgi:hypothetical protein